MPLTIQFRLSKREPITRLLEQRLDRGLKAATNLLLTRLKLVLTRANTGQKRIRVRNTRRGKKGTVDANIVG